MIMQACAGVTATSLCFPLDVLRTRIMVEGSGNVLQVSMRSATNVISKCLAMPETAVLHVLNAMSLY